jgi:hypothetical protein
MAVPGPIGTALGPGAVPELSFAVQSAEAVRYAAAPTLRFVLGVDAGGAAIRSVMLDVQLRIAATRRSYAEPEQAQLAELFGEPHRWGETLRSLLWTQASLVVPPFEGSTSVDLLVPCTYDFEVASAKYFTALRGGDVPIELLFSGTVFHTEAGGRLQVSRISWSAEAAYALPVRVWREAVDVRFPGAAWLRVDREAFDRLATFKARRALMSWEAVIDALLDGRDEEEPG